MIFQHRSFLLDKAVMLLLSILALIPFAQVLHLNLGFAIFDANELLLFFLLTIFILIVIERGIAKQHALYVLFVFSVFVLYSLYSIAILDVGITSLVRQIRFFLPFIVACVALLSRLYIDRYSLINILAYAISFSAFTAIVIHLFFTEFIIHAFSSSQEVSRIILEGGRMYWGSGALAFFGLAALMIEKNKYKRYVLNFLVLIILTASLFTQNRTMLAGLILFYFCTQKYVFNRSIKATLSIFILLVVSLVFFIYLSSDDMISLLQRRLFITDASDREFEDAFLIGRVSLYNQYLNAIQSSFPFGQGLGLPLSYGIFSGIPVFTTDISFVSFVLPFGLVGFILLFVFIFKIFNSFNKYAKVHAGDKSSKVFYFITLSATLVAFNVDIFSRNIFVVYLAVFAVLLHIPSIKKYN